MAPTTRLRARARPPSPSLSALLVGAFDIEDGLRQAVAEDDERRLHEADDAEGAPFAPFGECSDGHAAPSPFGSPLSDITASPDAVGLDADDDIPDLALSPADAPKNNKKRRQRNRKRERKKNEQRGRALPTNIPADAATPRPIRVAYDAAHLPVCKGAWVCKRQASSASPDDKDDLQLEGFRVFAWNGRDSIILEDRQGLGVAALAGRPDDPKWGGLTAEAARELLAEVDRIRAPPCHKRGEFACLGVGMSYGGGQKVPGNLVHRGANLEIARRFLRSKCMRRFAGFQSSCFALHAPKAFKAMDTAVSAIRNEYPALATRNFSNSAYPACTFNVGPNTVCVGHTDSGNGPGLWCAITAFGDFDPTKGGHLVLYDLKLIIEFPPGSTILIPSGALRHGNTPVQDGETRMSMTQYCAGGLLRWHAYGFRKPKDVPAKEAAAINGTGQQRLLKTIGLLSKVKELARDRAAAFPGKK